MLSAMEFMVLKSRVIGKEGSWGVFMLTRTESNNYSICLLFN